MSFLYRHLKIILLILTTGVVWLIEKYFDRACLNIEIPPGLWPGGDYFPELSYQCTIAEISNWVFGVSILVTLTFAIVGVVKSYKTNKTAL